MNDNQEIEEILRKVIDENQYYDGDTSYMPITAFDEAKAKLLALKQKWEQAARIQSSRDYWLYVHDIVRDRTQRIFDKQEVIDIGSESYALNTGESIQLWFGNQSDKELNNE